MNAQEMHAIKIIPMTTEEYATVIKHHAEDGDSDVLWNFPLEELDILCDEDHECEYALIETEDDGKRLFELPADWFDYAPSSLAMRAGGCNK